ncbi:outer membrane chaperone Skp [Maritimibacter sp. 55A14]|uniref:OmpH family outer membrane protein n=1 Tax=Maritimibacter sp. 55A14 TaxID=2174844 RepID=UPI000D608269|nr:OmpH family outer membrane protein [Maritimibacter sp. 55A14]PWE34290.1 outer membrane chaperone Skp [Maritimibacter sp. 55A14]
MMGRRGPARILGAALAWLIAAWLPVVAAAQDGLPRSPVLTLDQERLFSQSDFGQRVLRELEQQANDLAAENRRIEAELTAEERELTERRPEMDAAQFRDLADAFDERVVAIRARQDKKARDIEVRTESERQRFFEASLPVLLGIVQEAGAAVLLQDRAIILSAGSIDITDIAIERVNAELGDGSQIGEDTPAEPPAPAPGAPVDEPPEPTGDAPPAPASE